MPTTVETPAQSPPPALARKLLGGASALALATGMERGMTFAANLLAARFGGASNFGAYSLALTTANNIAAYAGAGIGSTATRFAGRYPREQEGYRTFTRALLIVSGCSVLLAGAVLYLAAGPLAGILHNQSLAPLLQLAALCSAGMIAAECLRGFLVGQRKFPALFLLSGIAGLGMLSLLPAASRLGPLAMVAAQAAVSFLAIAVLLSRASAFQFAPLASDRSLSGLPEALRSIWRFGFVQLAGVAGLNAAGWWTATLVARADPSLREMGFLAVAGQLRNLAALAPGMLTQSIYAMLAPAQSETAHTPDQVVLASTYYASTFIFAVSGTGIVLMPQLLPLLFGHSFGAGTLAASLGMATAAIHMTGGPAAARLTIVSLRWSGAINAVWSVALAILATCLISHFAAAQAMTLYLALYFASLVAVLAVLRQHGSLANGMSELSIASGLAGLTLGALAWWRTSSSAPAPATWSMVAALAAFFFAMHRMGRRYGLLPPIARLREIAIQPLRRFRS